MTPPLSSSGGAQAWSPKQALLWALLWILKAPIWLYRLTLSAFFGHACRYHPTCSAYALEALDRHGPGAGVWMAVRRMMRCHPWGGSGYDPVVPLDPDLRRRDP